MPPIIKKCKITGKDFVISELEQKLRKKFDVPLPDVHPYERLRYLLNFRDVYTLYHYKCDLCGKSTLSVWGDHPNFPVYCRECWYSDKWKPVEQEIDFDRPFFEQFKELSDKGPHPARLLQGEFVNSEYCNSATNLKNCYMCFSVQESEDSYYVYTARFAKNNVDVVMSDDAELLYECVSCHNSYHVFWSEFAIHCRDCYFLYDCVDCSDCALSTGLRHKQYYFLNEKLSKEQYVEKVKDFQTGSYKKIQEYIKKYQEIKKAYPKRFEIGNKNEDVSGDLIFNSKSIQDCYLVKDCENSANIFNMWGTKDSLDVVCFGVETEQVYCSTSIGNKSNNIKFSWSCYMSSYNIEYSSLALNCHDCFGCAFARKIDHAIFNKKYSEKEYHEKVSLLKEKMKERGEYGQMFPPNLIPFAYNESIAQLNMPLSKKEAEKRGFRWVEKEVSTLSPEKIYKPKDNIHDIEWSNLDGKALVCEESQRPFKIVKQEFEFYKKFNIPLPRLHPEIRLFRRYPTEIMFNLHEAKCDSCKTPLKTSMPEGDRVLCETCYQKNIL